MSRRWRWAGAASGVAAAVVAATALAACSGGPPPAAGPGAGPAAAPACDPAAQEVRSAEALHAALASAGPGTSLRLADGVYPGGFRIGAAGTAASPAMLCGGRGAVLDGGAPDAGYALHLEGADHWRLTGFTVRGGQKGLMLDASSGVVVDGLEVRETGDEAVHLRAGSSDNVVRGTTIRATGLRRPEFGEGVYVGSAESNWCRHSACGPDRADRNRIESNDIAETTAEAVDVKEGTTGGSVIGNRFSGAGTTAADSWVDVKGTGWTVADNVGVAAPGDGFQVHEITAGSGTGNVFERNVATVDGPGYGFHVTGGGTNRVACSNRAEGAGAGLSNIPCS